jgi:electron transport complex protein RnfC
MRPTRTFRHGGIEVEAGRDWTPAAPVPNAFLPNSAVVVLKQHAGAPSRCVVRRGEYVREGAIIGRAEGELGANVHAPVPGVVREIRRIALPEGGEADAVVIALEGSFNRLGKRGERYIWKSMSRADMLHTLRDRGVVCADASGMPLRPPHRRKGHWAPRPGRIGERALPAFGTVPPPGQGQ